MADQTEFGTDRSAGIHGKPSGLGGSYRGRRDWIGGALVPVRMGTRCCDRVYDRYRMSGNNFVVEGVSAHVHCETGGAFRVASPLTVQGQLELDIVFPGLCCKMLFVVANIGSDGLLDTEALQSYLPHQLDLRTGQLWADGWSMLQLHQQRLTPDMDGLLTTSVVIPPDSEIVAKFSVSGARPHGCVLVEPARQLIEEYGILVGYTLVDASSGWGSVLIVNPNEEVVVLPGRTFIAILVAMEDTSPPVHDSDELPEYLEEIVKGSHTSLGEPGRQLLRDLLLRYKHDCSGAGGTSYWPDFSSST